MPGAALQHVWSRRDFGRPEPEPPKRVHLSKTAFWPSSGARAAQKGAAKQGGFLPSSGARAAQKGAAKQDCFLAFFRS